MNKYILIILLSLSLVPSSFSMQSTEKVNLSQITQVLVNISQASTVESALEKCLQICEDPSYSALPADEKLRLFRAVRALTQQHNKRACYVACRLIEKNEGSDDYTPEERREFIITHLSLVAHDLPEASIWLLDLETDVTTVLSLCAQAEQSIDKFAPAQKKAFIEKIITKLRSYSSPSVELITELLKWYFKSDAFNENISALLLDLNPAYAHQIVTQFFDALKKWAAKSADYSHVLGLVLHTSIPAVSDKNQRALRMKTALSCLTSAADRGDISALWDLLWITEATKNGERCALLARAEQQTKKNAHKKSPSLAHCVQRAVRAFEETAKGYDEFCALGSFYAAGIPGVLESDEKSASHCYGAAYRLRENHLTALSDRIKLSQTMLHLIASLKGEESEELRQKLVNSLTAQARNLPSGTDALITLVTIYLGGEYGIAPDAEKLKDICTHFCENDAAPKVMRQLLAKTDVLEELLPIGMDTETLLALCDSAEHCMNRLTPVQRKSCTEKIINKLHSYDKLHVHYEALENCTNCKLLTERLKWLLKDETHNDIIAGVLGDLYRTRSFGKFEYVASKLSEQLARWSHKHPEHTCILGLLYLECARAQTNKRHKMKAVEYLKSASEQGYAPATWTLVEGVESSKNNERVALFARAVEQTRSCPQNDLFLAGCAGRAIVAIETDPESSDELYVLGLLYAQGLSPFIDQNESRALRCYKRYQERSVEHCSIEEGVRLCSKSLGLIASFQSEESATYRKSLLDKLKTYAQQLPEGIDALTELIQIYSRGNYGIAADTQELSVICKSAYHNPAICTVLRQFLLQTEVIPLILDCETDPTTLLAVSEIVEPYLDKLEPDQRTKYIKKLIEKLLVYWKAHTEKKGEVVTELLRWLLKENNDPMILDIIGYFHTHKAYEECEPIASKLFDPLKKWSTKSPEFSFLIGLMLWNCAETRSGKKQEKLRTKAVEFLKAAAEKKYASALWALLLSPHVTSNGERCNLFMDAVEQTKKELAVNPSNTVLELSVEQGVASFEAFAENYDDYCSLGWLYAEGLPPLIERDERRAVRAYKAAYLRETPAGGRQATISRLIKHCLNNLFLMTNFTSEESAAHRKELIETLKNCAVLPEGIDALSELLSLYAHGGYGMAADPEHLREMCQILYERNFTSNQLATILNQTKLLGLLDVEKFISCHYYIAECHFIAAQYMQPDFCDFFLRVYNKLFDRAGENLFPEENMFKGALRYCEVHEDPSVAAFFVSLALRELHRLKTKYMQAANSKEGELWNVKAQGAIKSLANALGLCTRILIVRISRPSSPFLDADWRFVTLAEELKLILSSFHFAGLKASEIMLIQRAHALLMLLIDSDYMAETFYQSAQLLQLLGKTDPVLQMGIVGMLGATAKICKDAKTEPKRKLLLCYALAVLHESDLKKQESFRAMIQLALECGQYEEYVKLCTAHDPVRYLECLRQIPDNTPVSEVCDLVNLRLLVELDFYAHYTILAQQTDDPQKKARYRALIDDAFERALKIDKFLAHLHAAAEYIEGVLLQRNMQKFREHFKQAAAFARERTITLIEFSRFKALCDFAVAHEECDASLKSEILVIQKMVKSLYEQRQKK